MDKGEVDRIEAWEENGDVVIVITYEDGGYDELSLPLEEVGRIFSYLERKGLSRFLGMLRTDIEKAQAIAKFADLVGLPMSKVAQLRSQLARMKRTAKAGGDKEV